MPAAKKKCICQICTCGRHMCPHRKKEQLVLGGEQRHARSRSQEDRRAQRRQWAVPNDNQDISLKRDLLNTTFVLSESKSFSALNVEDKGNSNRSTVRHESRSWSSNQIPKTLPIRRPDNLKAEGSADFTTTHQHDFNEKKSESHASRSVQVSSSTVQAESWNKRQVPRTQKIKKADTLTLSDPLNLETTHHSEYSETISKDIDALGESNLHETYQRPRTSLKLSGEFQSDSSYQQAFTLKHAEDRVQVQKGVTTSHLKPEGEMTFDTTSLDYNAVSTHVSRASEMGDGLNDGVSLKPKRMRPQSEIKISSVPISDETTLTSDFKKWNVEKPKRHKPADTLQIGDTEDMVSTSTHRNGDSSFKLDTSTIETSMSENWQVTRPVVQKPQNNLKLEGDFHFDTTHDIDYNSRKETSKRTSILEALTERTETESIRRDDDFAREIPAADTNMDNSIKFGHVAEVRDTEKNMDASQQMDTSSAGNAISQEVLSDVFQQKQEVISDIAHQDNEIRSYISHQTQEASDISHQQHEEISDISHQKQEVISDVSHQTQEVISETTHHIEQKAYDNNEFISQSEDQMQYVTWDDVRPKPIRPHSNLRQEGGMEFETTNRSEFISRPTERVKGIKPKEATKLFGGDFDATTMNQTMFTSNQVEKVSPIRPVSNLHVEKGNFIDETTSSREFQPWKVEKPSPIVPRSNLAQEGTMDFTTTNNTEFEEKQPEKVYPIRPTTTNKISGDLELITTNKVMHSEFPLDRVQKIVPQSTLRMNSGVFESETTNKSQFQEWEIDRPKPIRPVPNLTQEGSMDFTTMNQMQFDEKSIEKVNQLRPHTLSKITGDFDGVTTNQIMFAAQPSQRPNMIIPKGNLEVEKGKFATDTTNRSEFQQWQQVKPDPVTPRNNLQQEGIRDFTTTNQVQYGAKPIDRVTNIRPKTNTKTIGVFDGTTTNQVMFQDSPREKLQAIRPQNNIQLEKGNFNAETTNNREFQQKEFDRSKQIRPTDNLSQKGAMDFTTTTDREYVGKTSERVSPIKHEATTRLEGKFEGTTTNQAMFKTNDTFDRVKGNRPTTNIHLEKGKMESQTTASREFQQKEFDRSKQIRPSDNLTQEGEMYFTTTTDREYMGKTSERVSPIRPAAGARPEGKFEGTTTNQAMFKTNDTFDRVKGNRPTTNLHVEKGKMECQTTASREFQQKEFDRSKQIRPSDNLTQEGEMYFTTTTDREYMEKTSERVSPIRPAAGARQEGKFEGTTTNQAMFKTNDTFDRVKGNRPTTNLHVEKGKMECQTTASREFQQKEFDRSKQIRPSDNLTQEGEMCFTTTTDREYMGKTSERVSPIRPAAGARPEGKFEGTTTNQAMFKTNDTFDRVKGNRPTTNLHVEKGKMECQTTASREFQQKEFDRSKQIKPTDNLTQEGEMYFTTTTDREYMGKTSERVSPIRPAAGARPEGKFEGTTTNQAMFKTNDTFDRVKCNRPTTNLHVEKGKMECQTTASREFQQKEFDRSKQIRPSDNLTQEGEMYFTTTTDREYMGKTSERVSPIKPAAGARPEGKFEGTTTNQAMFKTNDTFDRVKGNRPTTNLHVEKGKMECQTTASREFQQKEFDRSEQIRPSDNLTQEGEMYFTTTTDREYMGKTSERVSPIRPAAGARPEGKFEGTTTNQAMFKTNDTFDRVKCNRPTTNLHVEKGKMECQTTASREFQQKEFDRSKQIRPSDNLTQEGEMYFTTTTDREYMGKTSERVSPIKPAAGARPEGKFEGTTTNQAMFKTNDTFDRVKGNRPTTNLHVEKGKMECQTTASREFQQKEFDRSEQIRPSDNLTQEGEMYFTTTTDREYMGKTSERVSPIRPAAGTRPEGKFEGTTTNQAMFKTNDTFDRVKGNRPTTNLHVEKGKMECQTTASREFQQKEFDRSKQIRPSDNLTQEGEMYFTTTTDREYMGKTSERVSPIRPAAGTRPEGKFEGTTTNQAMFKTNDTFDRVKGNRPTTNLHVEKGKMECQTTASREFQQKEFDRSKQIRPTDNLTQEGEMYFTTTTDREYMGKTSEKVSPIRPAAGARPEGKFEGTTTNQAMFKTNDTFDRVKGNRPTTNLHVEKGKMESQTTASREFQQKEFDRSKQIRPSDNLTQEGEMYFTTTTDREYMGKTSERVSPIKPAAGARPEGKFEGTTTNQAMFKTNDTFDRVKGNRPTTNLHVEKGKMECQTTASREFQQKEFDRSEQIRPSDNLTQEGEMYFTTTTDREYMGKTSERVSPIRPAAGTRSEGKFEGTTTNQAMFKTNDTFDRVKGNRPTTNLHVEKGKMECQTTASREFQQKEFDRSKQIRPTDNLTQEEEMYFTTTTDREYMGKTSERVSPIKPAASTRPEGKFEGTTTNQAMFKTNDTFDRVKGNRPTTNLHVEKGKMECQTTASREFQQKEFDRSEQIRPSDNLTQEGEMYFTTTTDREYMGKTSERVSPIRPAAGTRPEGKFEGTTTNQAMFKTNDTFDRVKGNRPTTNLHVEKGKMECQTTASREFQQKEFDRSKQIRPSDNLTQEGEMYFTTTTDREYMGKTSERVSPIRPAAGTRPEGKFEGTTTNQAMFKTNDTFDRVKGNRPTTNLHVEKGKMECQTTASREFQQKEFDRSKQIRPTDNLTQEGEMYFTTTTDREYMGKTSEKVSPIRPAAGARPEGKFEGTTTNQAMFKTNDTFDRVKGNRPTTNLHVEKGKMESQTTASREFQQKEFDRSKQIRPTDNLTQEGEMYFTTTTDREYMGKTSERVSPIRPAAGTMREGKFEGTTTNQAMFKTNDTFDRVKGNRPTTNLHVEKGKMECQTTASREFQQKEFDKPKQIRPTDNLIQEGVMDFTTTSDREYMGKTAERVSPVKHEATTKLEGKFEGTTTNQAMYNTNNKIERVKVKRPATNLHLEKGKMESQSTASREFQQKEFDRSKQIKPTDNLTQEGEMYFTTTTDREYVGKTSERVSPIKHEATTKLEGKFEGTTTNQAMYNTNNKIERVQGKRPATNLHLESGKMESQSTASREFQQKEFDRPKQIRPTDNLIQQGAMDFTTTTDREYAGKTSERVSPIKHEATTKLEGKFEGTTTNQAMFNTNNKIERVEGKRPTTNLHLEKGKMESQSTSSREFQQKEFDRSKQVRPTDNLIQEGAMDFTTTTDREYMGKTSERVSPIKPAAATMVEGKFEGTTTNQAMFKTNDTIDRVTGNRPTTNIHLEKGKMESQTTASREFQQWEINRPRQIKPSGNLIQEGDMDFTTSNQTDFSHKQITKVESMKPLVSSAMPGEFDGTTTNQVMFQGQTMEKVHDIRPKDNLKVDSGKFNEETTTSREYGYKTGNKLDAIKQKSTQAQEGQFDFLTSNQTQFEERSKFDSITTNQATFQTPVIDTVQEIKPNNNLHVEGGKFQNQTTSSEEYQQRNVQKPTAFQLASSLKQEGPMQFDTTNKAEFKERSFERVQQIRPKTTNKITEGEFDSTTTNKAMFQQHSKVDRVKPIRHQDNLHLETGKFNKETTNSRDFRQWVKMETKDSPSKGKTPAAGVRTQTHKSSSKKETTEIQKTKAGNDQYEPWKLNEESTSIKPKSINDKKLTSDNSDVTNISSKSTSKTKVVSTDQSNGLVLTTSNSEQQVDRSLGKNAAQTLSSEQTTSVTGKNFSTMTSDSAGKQQSARVSAIIPSGNISSGGDMTFTTTSKSAYTRQTGSSYKQGTDQLTTISKSGNATSTFTDKQLDMSSNKNASQTQSPQRTINANEKKQQKSQNMSTMSSDYAGKQGGTRVNAIIPSGNIIAGEGEMTFSTTSKTDYVRQNTYLKSSEKHERAQTNIAHSGSDMLILQTSENRRTPKAAETHVKGSNASTQNSSPQSAAISRTTRRSKPADNLKIEAVPFDGASTTQTTFTKMEARRSSSKKPTESLKQEGKMEFNTTSNDYSLSEAYNAGREATKAKSKKEQRSSLGQSGTMDFHTTSNSSYTGNFGSKSKNLRPRSSIKLGTDENANDSMSSTRSNPETSVREYQNITSTSRAAYIGHTPTRTRAFRPNTSQKVGGSFEGQTTSRSSFVAQDRVEKSRAVKPANHNILNAGNGFTGGSTYRKDFEAAKCHHCPVLDLQSGSKSFTASEEKNGHIFYAEQLKE